MKNKKIKWDSNLVKNTELIFDYMIIIFSFFLITFLKELMSNESLLSIMKNFINIRISLDLILTNAVYIFFAFLFFSLYKTSVTNKDYLNVMFNVALSLFFSVCATLLFSIIFPIYFLDPFSVLLSGAVQFFLLAIFKFVFWKFIKNKNIKFILILGPKEEADLLSKKCLNDKSHYMRIKYIYYYDKDIRVEKLEEFINDVDQVYLTSGLPEKIKNDIIVYTIAKKRMNCYLVPKLYEIGIINSFMTTLDDSMIFGITSLELSLGQKIIKRFFDIGISLVVLTLTSPLLFIVAIIIKAQDGGRIFFKQERLTRDNKKFMLYKFRSMVMNAEAKTGAIWAKKNDHRITKFGKFIRKTRIDELPQLINVLLGNISFVGPRAEREYFTKEFTKDSENFPIRLNVKAGLTGLAQIYGKYDTTPEEKLRYDLLYIRKYSLFYDIKIVIKTLKVIFDHDSTRGVNDENLNIEEYITKKNRKYVKISDNILKVWKE